MTEEFTINYERILIVDDEEITRMMLRRVLEEAGYLVLEAADGLQGVELCLRECPNVVLLDVRMPVMNGFDACRAIRQEPAICYTPVLILTSLDDVVAVQLAFEAGATDFITKPINWALLAQRVRYALRARQIELQLRESETRLARAQRIARLGSWRYAIDADWINLSEELCQLLGGKTRGITSRALFGCLVEDDLPRVKQFIEDLLHGGAAENETEFRIILGEGRIRSLLVSADVGCDEHGQVNTLFGVAQDVTERRDAEARLSYLAHFDPVTGLPNRVLFRDRAAQAIAAARRNGDRCAVVKIMIDPFHKVNASFGAAAADQALRRLAERFQSVLRARDTLSRFGGDDFVAVLTDIHDAHEAASIIQRIAHACAEPIQLDEREVRVATTIGIALCPEDGADIDRLLLHASSAQARAREMGGAGYQFYTADLHQQTMARLSREAALYRALERDEFVLHFQPQLDLRRRCVTSVEALLRWQHPEWGLQMPDQFIDILEETGLIVEVGDWVIRQACQEIRALPLAVSVNLSPRQFRRPGFAKRVLDILDEIAFPVDRLELEITEQFFMRDEQEAITILETLRDGGVRVSIDDYGTGYSSLRYLKRLPVNVLKIDRSFVKTLVEDRADQAIVRSTIDLCHTLNMVVIAEGVEDHRTLDALAAMGCDAVQGYYLSRPLPMDRLIGWLDNAIPAFGEESSANPSPKSDG